MSFWKFDAGEDIDTYSPKLINKPKAEAEKNGVLIPEPESPEEIEGLKNNYIYNKEKFYLDKIKGKENLSLEQIVLLGSFPKDLRFC